MPSSTRMPPRTLPCRCRVRDDYSVEVCNTLVGDHWYFARTFRTLRTAHMFCKREHLNVIEAPQ